MLIFTMLKKLLYIFISILFLTAITPVFADNFGPWNTHLKTGDALTASPHTHRISADNAFVYNGVQGGAYIMIRFFQVAISPQDGPACRYTPVCSAYGRLAVQRFGAFLGALLAGDRILRCNPYNPPGTDAVPHKLYE